MSVRTAASVIIELIELASMGGNLMLNISPRGDGSIPQEQQQALLAIGEWLKHNGDAIYDARPWRLMGEGPGILAEPPPDWKGGSTADQSTAIKDDPGTVRAPHPGSDATFRYTVANHSLYALGLRYPTAGNATLLSLSTKHARVERVTLLGASAQPVPFKQTGEALVVSLPSAPPIGNMPYAMRIEGRAGLAPA